MATSGQYYKIRIGAAFYLTTDNTANGVPCYLNVTGAEDFYTEVFGVEIDTDQGRVVQAITNNSATGLFISVDFSIVVSIMKKADWDYLKTVRNGLLAGGGSVQIVGTGSQASGIATPGNFDVYAKPKISENFTFQKFDDEMLYDVKMSFYTVAS